jgi:hypothetical protein
MAMKVESPQFTAEEIQGFVTDYFDHEKALLVDRLRNIVDEVDSLASSVPDGSTGDDVSWSPVETLAHMVTSSQYFGWLAHQVASKKEELGDILEMLKLRDVVSGEAAQLPVETLNKQFRQNIERTIRFIEKTPYEALRTKFDYVGLELSVEDLIRIPLCSHLESHIEQIRASLA